MRNKLVKKYQEVTLLEDNMDLQKAAMVLANPLTVLNMYEVVEKFGAKAVVCLAAASALNKMFLRFCQQKNIEVINIVRKDEQVEELRDTYKAKYVLNKESEDFFNQLKPLIEELKPTILFECLGGDFASKIFALMPQQSRMIILGCLSEKPLIIDSFDSVHNRKSFDSLFVVPWFEKLSAEQRKEKISFILDDINNKGGSIFSTKIVNTFPLDQWEKAMEESHKNASQGKILIKCD